MKTRYIVELLKGKKYRVWQWVWFGSISTGKYERSMVFQGTITECNAYIQLKEKRQI